MSEGQIALILVVGLVVVLVAVTIRFPYRARPPESASQTAQTAHMTQGDGESALIVSFREMMRTNTEKITTLQATVDGLKDENTKLRAALLEKEKEIAELRRQIDWLTRMVSGGSIDNSHSEPNPRKKPVLIVSSAPKAGDALETDVETRSIEDALRRSGFSAVSIVAARPRDIAQAVLDYSPDILHFSGHGVNGDIVLEDENRQPKVVSLDAIARLLKAQPVSGIVLNACYSAKNQNVLLTAANWVVGMRKPIGDPSAIAFSVGFYQALAAGREARVAFEFGASSAGMENLGQMDVPVFVEGRK